MNNIFAVSGVVLKEMYRRKDFYVLLIITVFITGLMASVTFFQDDKIIRYLKEICLLLIWISSLVIAISTTARQIPGEKESRTIFPLLAKPVTRSELLIGKFLGCWLACGIALVCFYVFFGCVSASREHHWPLLNYFQAATLHWVMLAILIAFVLLGSLVFTAPSSNATVCFILAVGILLLGRHLNQVALHYPQPAQSIVYAIYYAIPHLEVFDVRDLIIHNWPGIEWRFYAIAIIYALIYSAVFLAGACLLFRRKALN
jgi:ABC-type transport system involved in multi-copper enzyme maturation permease subunit